LLVILRPADGEPVASAWTMRWLDDDLDDPAY
jgi:hypothetical protein